jgi:hypothetical protein
MANPEFKNNAKPGPGRPKGLANKATRDAREAVANFVEKSTPRMLAWLDQVANGMPEYDIKPNPAKAIELVQSVCEYHIPKLARTEVTGANGGPLAVVAAQMTDDQLASYIK